MIWLIIGTMYYWSSILAFLYLPTTRVKWKNAKLAQMNWLLSLKGGALLIRFEHFCIKAQVKCIKFSGSSFTAKDNWCIYQSTDWGSQTAHALIDRD